MARYFEFTGGSVGLAWAWNLDSAIGPNCANLWDDVMLFQCLFNGAAPSLNKLVDPRTKRPWAGYLVRDGKFGPITKAAVEAYQGDLTARGKYVKADGRIDPSSADGWNPTGQYTIVYLNRDYRDIQGHMLREQDCPPKLRAKLTANRHGVG